ncbi:hypothetical protein SAMN05518849_11654 [Sphingobium sp. AP50]|uniref:hypothetical protein n=1 Tax=Sphingobium sp. AP50 TaxID=1884369 RepID=UPI0008BFFE71|nr:hypothetical protein [Sphingobium sp. AP50]SEJ87095.1 hypothetical protein SAMN05518849_11654 [Sphingobium sp. AP50]
MAWTEEYFTRLRSNIDAYQDAQATGSVVVLAILTDEEFDQHMVQREDVTYSLTGLNRARTMRFFSTTPIVEFP